jgi:processive rubber oxygenase RoxA-like protein
MRASLSIRRLSSAVLIYSVAASSVPARAETTPPLQYAKQGWTEGERQAFYTTSQGSHMIPYAWFKALRRLDVDEPFAGDQLQRYGYLPNEKSKLNPEGLPVGFVIDGDPATDQLGMTCAACHTGQIEYVDKSGVTQQLRIDGAPATANFQLFLADLTAATRATLSDPARFDKFAHAALGSRYSSSRLDTLKSDFSNWVKQWGNFMDKSLPASPWGPGRLDAFGMIFNRVAAKDLGIDGNFKVADAPVSYPFLWNAPRQDRTQWNGGAPNGLYINAIGRNAGEVFGVFGEFTPKKQLLPPHYNYRNNSVNFTNLQALEEKIASLRPPSWPFGVDDKLVDQGRVLFASHCGSCHDIRPVPPEGLWVTKVLDAKTDPKMYQNSIRTSDTGILNGALSPNPPGSKLGPTAPTGDILATTVVGALLGDAIPPLPRLANPKAGVWLAVNKDIASLFADNEKLPSLISLLEPSVRDNVRTHIESRLANMFKMPGEPNAYEARVLHGIWATAPYLHNGSVPNLYELLLPPDKRSPSFMVGSRKYDSEKVGYVTTESPYKDGTLVVGAGAQAGNSNVGHDYSSDLSDDDRKALLEYLKQL